MVLSINRINEGYEWIRRAQSFFLSSLINCDSLLLEFKRRKFKYSYREKYDFGFCSGNLIFPIIFNFKHGIELYIKGIGNFWDEGKEYNHNLEELLRRLKGKILQKGVKRKEKILKIIDDEIFPLVSKYFYGQYFLGEDSVSNPDLQNEAERYHIPGPRNPNCYKIPYIVYPEEVNSESPFKYLIIDQESIKNIRKDIKRIFFIFKRYVTNESLLELV